MSAAPRQAPAVGGGPAGPAGPAAQVRVTRSRRSALWAGVLGLALIAGLAMLPYLVFQNVTSLLVEVFYLIVMASMWNMLAGYAGLVSVGQQAFIGLGAYAVVIPALHGVNAFAALPLSVVVAGAAGLVGWWLVSRLRTGYFAIATWVIATICEQIISRYQSLGGGTGVLLPLPASLSANLLGAYTYWISLVVLVAGIGVVFLIMRSRTGLALTALRDDETAAHSAGARVARTQRLVFVVAAAGCGAAGAVYVLSFAQFLQPSAAFSVTWSAEIIFITIIGGIGTIEGPILGTIVFVLLEHQLSHYGAWYFIILGLVAMVIAIWAPRGLWGLIADRFGIRLFPVGYYLHPATDAARQPRRRLTRR
jgi:branched-chain amino acid transport system permease protein